MLIYTRHDPRFFDQRLYKGGGDGGAGAAREQEAARQAQVQASVDAINSKFGIGNPAAGAQRESLYTDIAGATTDTNKRALDRQSTEAQRQNDFGLARSGLIGGSSDAESNANLKERYGEGVIQATAAGNAAAASLRDADERTRQNLTSLAQSGLDTGTAASLAEGQLGAAAEASKAATTGVTIGNLFNDLSQGYLQNKQLKATYPNGLPQQQSNGFSSNLFTPGGYVGKVIR